MVNEVHTAYHYLKGVWTYPVAFIEYPDTIATPRNFGNNSSITAKVQDNATQCSILLFIQETTTGNFIDVDTGINVNLISIGRWK